MRAGRSKAMLTICDDERTHLLTMTRSGFLPAAEALRGVGKLACFACLVLLLAIVFNALITSGLRRINTSSFGVWNRIVDGTINAEIVISGSSRALTHYDPRIIEERTGLRAFNIGLNGS